MRIFLTKLNIINSQINIYDINSTYIKGHISVFKRHKFVSPSIITIYIKSKSLYLHVLNSNLNEREKNLKKIENKQIRVDKNHLRL